MGLIEPVGRAGSTELAGLTKRAKLSGSDGEYILSWAHFVISRSSSLKWEERCLRRESQVVLKNSRQNPHQNCWSGSSCTTVIHASGGFWTEEWWILFIWLSMWSRLWKVRFLWVMSAHWLTLCSIRWSCVGSGSSQKAHANLPRMTTVSPWSIHVQCCCGSCISKCRAQSEWNLYPKLHWVHWNIFLACLSGAYCFCGAIFLPFWRRGNVGFPPLGTDKSWEGCNADVLEEDMLGPSAVPESRLITWVETVGLFTALNLLFEWLVRRLVKRGGPPSLWTLMGVWIVLHSSRGGVMAYCSIGEVDEQDPNISARDNDVSLSSRPGRSSPWRSWIIPGSDCAFVEVEEFGRKVISVPGTLLIEVEAFAIRFLRLTNHPLTWSNVQFSLTASSLTTSLVGYRSLRLTSHQASRYGLDLRRRRSRMLFILRVRLWCGQAMGGPLARLGSWFCGGITLSSEGKNERLAGSSDAFIETSSNCSCLKV